MIKVTKKSNIYKVWTD